MIQVTQQDKQEQSTYFTKTQKMIAAIGGGIIVILLMVFIYISSLVEQRTQEITKLKADARMQTIQIDKKHKEFNK